MDTLRWASQTDTTTAVRRTYRVCNPGTADVVQGMLDAQQVLDANVKCINPELSSTVLPMQRTGSLFNRRPDELRPCEFDVAVSHRGHRHPCRYRVVAGSCGRCPRPWPRQKQVSGRRSYQVFAVTNDRSWEKMHGSRWGHRDAQNSWRRRLSGAGCFNVGSTESPLIAAWFAVTSAGQSHRMNRTPPSGHFVGFRIAVVDQRTRSTVNAQIYQPRQYVVVRAAQANRSYALFFPEGIGAARFARKIVVARSGRIPSCEVPRRMRRQ